jgi:hypothetical protein
MRQTFLPLRRLERRPARNFIVSFRPSAAEWQDLPNAQLNAPGKRLSGSEKVRAIVLNYLRPSGGKRQRSVRRVVSGAVVS